MRTIERDIVGGFIFSQDGKVLLGNNRDGGVYEGSFCVPSGGIEPGETKIQALAREMSEETGIDINRGQIAEVNLSDGEHEKTLRDTQERVFVKMKFYDFRIDLPYNAQHIEVCAEDDWINPYWFSSDEAKQQNLASPTRRTLLKIGFLLD